jgi:flagellar motor switch protein FliN/FliY
MSEIQETAGVPLAVEGLQAASQFNVRPARFEPLPASAPAAGLSGIGILMDVPLRISVELGRTHMSVRQVLELQAGSVVELNRMAGEAVDVMVNDRLMARGEVVVVDDKFGIRITEIVPGHQVEGD